MRSLHKQFYFLNNAASALVSLSCVVYLQSYVQLRPAWAVLYLQSYVRPRPAWAGPRCVSFGQPESRGADLQSYVQLQSAKA